MGGEKKNGNKEEDKKEKGPSTFVFKVDCLCEGCAIKILKCIHQFQGIETVKTENSTNKLTVIGAVDSSAIKEKLEKKTKKKVDLVSPSKKDDNKQDRKENKSDKDKNQGSDNNNNKAEKKPKEVPVTTADLKVQLKCQCQGCVVKIRKIISDTKGVHELKVDKVKELVTVKGTMDVKALAEALKDKMKKNVEIVPPKKEKEGKKEGGENGGGGGGGGGGENGGKKKNKGGNGGAGDGGKEANGGGDGGGKMEGKKMEVMVQPQFGYMPGFPGYGHPGYGYGPQHQQQGHGYPGYGPQNQQSGHDYPGYGQQGHGYPGYVPGYPISVHPPHHMFNDENPNACVIM